MTAKTQGVRRLRASLISTAICLGLGIGPGPAASQELEEVLVTATRRGETDLQSTPIAVSALTGDEFDAIFAQNIGEVALFVPNFSAAQITGFNAAGFAMRGASQTDILVYWEPPVGVLIDDFVVPHMQTQLLEPFDIEAVEVLRGPQGTLFGKNTTAGVVNVRTKRPSFEGTQIDATMRAGSFGRFDIMGALNLPLGETTALRVSAMNSNSDGYYKNGKASPNSVVGPVAGNGGDIGGDDVQTARVKLLWTPSENVDVLFQYEFLRDRSDSPPSVNETDPLAPQAWNLLGFPGVSSGDPLDQAGVTLRDDGLRMADGHQVDVDGLYMNINWDLGNYNLTSVTGQRNQDSRLPSTYTGEVFASLFDASRDDERETFQQELRLTSQYDGPFNWVGGIFYQSDETSFNVLQFLGLLDLFGASVPGVLDNNNPLIITNNQDMDSIAGFFDFTYDFAETWSVSAGIRYTREEKTFFSRPGTPIILYGVTTADYPFDPNDTGRFPCSTTNPLDCQVDTQTWNEPTYRLLVSNQFTDDVYGYASFAHGFKSGGYSDQAGSGLQAPLELTRYDPEEADSLEFGIKADLMDNTLRLNTAVFFAEYTDMQRAAIAQQGAFQETVVFNAAEVPAWGIEFEGTALLSDNLTMRFNFGYLDAEYDEFLLDLNLDGTPDQDLSGRPVTRAPEITAGVDFMYDFDIQNGGLQGMLGAFYEDESTYYYAADGAQFDTFLQERTLINASLTYTAASENWYVAFFGKNLTDERYRNASQYVGGLWTFSTYAPPREYGIEFGINL